MSSGRLRGDLKADGRLTDDILRMKGCLVELAQHHGIKEKHHLILKGTSLTMVVIFRYMVDRNHAPINPMPRSTLLTLNYIC
jgi:hypothetical protein